MNRETAVLDEEVKHETAKASTGTSVPRTGGLAASAPASAKIAAQPETPASKATLRERVKQIFSKLAKALEGDHGHQNYR